MRVAEIAERVGCDPESAYAKFADTREGTRFHNMQWPIFVTDENYRSFCKALADYANSEEGPQSNGRHELFLSVHELFEKGNEIGGALKKRHYNLDKSFIGTDEANLMLLKAAHKGMTQQAIAAYLGCSRTAVQKRLSALAGGVRFGDSYIKAEPTSRGGLKSTAYPIFLPLRLHEVYLMLSASSFLDEKPARPRAGFSFCCRTNGLSFVAQVMRFDKKWGHTAALRASAALPRHSPSLPLRRPRIEPILLGISLQQPTCPRIK